MAITYFISLISQVSKFDHPNLPKYFAMVLIENAPAWTWPHFFFGLTYALVASFLFLFIVLFLFKPKIRISPFLCKYKFSDFDQRDYYFIKIVNISLFSAYDVQVELLQVDWTPAGNNQMNNRYTSLSLVRGSISHIPGYRPSWMRKNAPYAIRVRTAENIANILEDEYKSVMVQVSLRHGLTGLVRVVSREFASASDVKTSKFKYGLKFGPQN